MDESTSTPSSSSSSTTSSSSSTSTSSASSASWADDSSFGSRLLKTGELLRCPDDQPVWLSVVRGRIWLTCADDTDDHFLDSGQSMWLPAGARALLSAEAGGAQVMLLRASAGRTIDPPETADCADP